MCIWLHVAACHKCYITFACVSEKGFIGLLSISTISMFTRFTRQALIFSGGRGYIGPAWLEPIYVEPSAKCKI